jgi:hypothetical protein
MSQAADALQARAEVLKLARILERDPASLAYLEPLALEDLRALRDRVTDVLWTAHGHTLNRLASASRLLPVGLCATISERAFGPLLTARMAGLLEPSRAVAVATKLDSKFLADVATELDPRRASDVIAQIPPRQISEVTKELLRRGEYVTMGRFVGHLQDDALVAAVRAMDDAALLRVAFVLEDKNDLEHLVGLLPEGGLAGIVKAAADGDLWLEALDLLDHLSEHRRNEIVATTLRLDHAAIEAIIAAVIEHDLWQEVLVIAEQDPTLQSKLADRLPALSRAERRRVADRARETGAISRLGRLGEALAG